MAYFFGVAHVYEFGLKTKEKHELDSPMLRLVVSIYQRARSKTPMGSEAVESWLVRLQSGSGWEDLQRKLGVGIEPPETTDGFQEALAILSCKPLWQAERVARIAAAANCSAGYLCLQCCNHCLWQRPGQL